MEENILNDRNGLDVIVKGPYKRGKKVRERKDETRK